MDPNGLFEAVLHGLSKLPSALIAAVLLGGPTAIWLIARFTHPPDLRKPEPMVPETLLWVCESCRSLNDDRLATCYRCHRRRAVEGAPDVGIAGGPGRPPARPVPASWLEAEAAGASRLAVDRRTQEPVIQPEELMVAVEPRLVEPRMKVSGRPSPAGPAVRHGRKPHGGGEAKSKR